MIPWFMILFSHLRFRKLHPEEVKNHPFKMPGGAFANYLTIAFLILVLIGMLFNKNSCFCSYWYCVLAVVTLYYFVRYNKKDQQAKKQH